MNIIVLNLKIINQYIYNLIYYQMIQYMWANGNLEKGMEEENKYGKMDLFMRDIGKIIQLMEMAELSILILMVYIYIYFFKQIF